MKYLTIEQFHHKTLKCITLMNYFHLQWSLTYTDFTYLKHSLIQLHVLEPIHISWHNVFFLYRNSAWWCERNIVFRKFKENVKVCLLFDLHNLYNAGLLSILKMASWQSGGAGTDCTELVALDNNQFFLMLQICQYSQHCHLIFLNLL